MLPLFLLFVILPIAEIMLLINVSASIGGWNTFFIVIITAFFGAYFVRQQGFMLIQQIQTKFTNGEAPSNEMAEGLLLLVAGILLITPGFLTDALGFLFTLPFSRGPIASFLMKRVAVRKTGSVHFTHSSFQSPPGGRNRGPDSQSGDIIDGEYTDKSKASTEADKQDSDKNRLN